jgi:hypothetical protein
VSKINTEETIKNIAWWIFLFISFLVMGNLFWRMVDNAYLKVIFVIIAIGLDLFRQYVVTKAKQYWKTNFWQSAALWFVYLVHFSIVIIASAGFTMSEVNSKSATAGIYNMEKDSIINTIQSNESEIKQLESLRETLDPAKWQYRQTSSRIDALQKANTGHYERLGTFKEVKIDIKDDVFGPIGKAFRIKGASLELYVFIVIAVLIELALLITSKSIKSASNIEKLEPATLPNAPVSVPATPATPNEPAKEIVDNKPLQVLKTYDNKPLTDEQQRRIWFVDELYRGVDESKLSPELNGIRAVKKSLRGRISDRKCDKIKDWLIDIGAIVTNNGKESRGLMTREDINRIIREG